MEFLLGLLVGGVIGWIVRKTPADDTSPTAIRHMLQRQLKNHAKEEANPDIAAGISVAAELIAPSTTDATNLITQTTAPSTTVPKNSIPKDSPKELDNVSILLYFGAFLMLAGVGLFVGLSPYSGSVKTIVVLAMAIIFYAAGLTVYKSFNRLKPVALTLTAIGLICLPLTGAAAYAYVGHESGPIIWFMTSLGSLAFYVFALYATRQSLIGYMSVFMSLSLWLSVVSIIEAPLYFFVWAMIVLAMVYIVAAKLLPLWEEAEEPLAISASIMVPAALGMSLLFGLTTIDPLHHGITALLGALFYTLAMWREESAETKHTYFALAYGLTTISVLLVSIGLDFTWIHSLYILIAAATIQLFILLALPRKLPEDWRQSALIMNGLSLGAAAIGALFVDQQALTTILIINFFIHSAVAFYTQYQAQLVLGLIVGLVLPIQIGFGLSLPPLEALPIGLSYIGIALTLLASRQFVKKFEFAAIFTVTYYLALLVAMLVGFYDIHNAATTLTVVGGSLVILGAYVHRYILAIPIGASLLAVSILINLHNSGVLLLNQTTYALFILSVGFYTLGKLHPLWVKHEPWRSFGAMWSSIGHLGFYGTAALPIFFNATVLLTPPTWNAVVLILAGAVTAYEAYTIQSRNLIYLGGGFSLMGFQWLLSLNDIGNVQFFAHLWAAYFAILAYHAHLKKHFDDKQTLTFLALIALTLPMAAIALAGDTKTGLLLLFESIGLLALGIVMKDSLVTRWGLVIAVLCVLYQLREFQFFTLTLLGAGIIGAGIYLLLKQENK